MGQQFEQTMDPMLAGRRFYDMVLVFPYKTSALVRFGDEKDESNRGLSIPTDEEKGRMEQWEHQRNGVLKSLQNCGLLTMNFYSRDRDEIFCKVGAEAEKLQETAENMKYKLQMKEEYLFSYAEYRRNYAGREELGYKDRRLVSHVYEQHVDDEASYPAPDSIFRSVDRINIIDNIIRSKDKGSCGLDIGGMLHKGELLHYFPLHETKKLNTFDRKWFSSFVTGQNIDAVRDYFGEKVAFYFLFMSYFIKALLLPGLVGGALFLVDILAQTPDNFTAIPFCIFMGIWSALFGHFARRHFAKHALRWGTLDIVPQLEPCRPEFYGSRRINPVTERVDLYFPWRERIWKVLFSYSVLAVTLIVLFFMIMCLFAFRHLAAGQPGGRLIFMVANALVVEFLNMAFTAVARVMNDQENHRTDKDYEQHLLAKSVVFKFVNSYISLYYIAFFKKHSYLFGMPMECIENDCLKDLSYQLAIFIIVRLTFANAVELGVPYFVMWWKSMREGRQFHTSFGLFHSDASVHMPDLSSGERQSKMEKYEEFEDMDEMLVTYGYTTLFVVACPWAPIAVMFGSILECYLDFKKLTKAFKRPLPVRVRDNEPWDTAFDLMGVIALFTNMAVLVFSSQEFDALTVVQKILVFFALEHIVMLARILIKIILPVEPRDVTIMKMKQESMVKKHLDQVEEEDHEMRQHALQDRHFQMHISDRDEDDDEGDY